MRDPKPHDSLSARRARRGRAVLVGYGLDDGEGHLRYTRCGSLDLYGGSSQAHEEMQRRAQYIQEEMARLGISLDGMSYEQFQVVQEIVERANSQ